MKDSQTRDAIIVTIIGFLALAAPVGIATHYNQVANANQIAIKNDHAQIKRLKNDQKHKKKTIYERQENLKQLNNRLHDATNTVLASQNILLADKNGAVSQERIHQAKRNLAKVTANSIGSTDNLLFDNSNGDLTLQASYPAQYKLSQDQIPVIIHAYNKQHEEVGFDILSYDTTQHIFSNITTYSIDRLKKEPKSEGTDYQSYLRRKKAEEKAKLKANQNTNNHKSKSSKKAGAK